MHKIYTSYWKVHSYNIGFITSEIFFLRNQLSKFNLEDFLEIKYAS